jgi:hypothetical protein
MPKPKSAMEEYCSPTQVPLTLDLWEVNHIIRALRVYQFESAKIDAITLRIDQPRKAAIATDQLVEKIEAQRDI